MTNSAIILTLIRSSPKGSTDTEIRERTGIRPHQQVNQICRRLADRGYIRREPGPDGRLINRPASVDSGIASCDPHPSRPVVSRPRRRGNASQSDELPNLELSDTLFVIPCSGGKRPGGACGDDGASILDRLPDGLADVLRKRRAAVAAEIEWDDSRRIPATKRYSGHLYQAAGARTFERLDAAGARLLVISGGYGVVLGREPIGMYEQVFREAIWPGRLVPRCLSAYAEKEGVRTVVGVLSTSTAYAKAFSKTRWPTDVIQAFLLSPKGARGAMVTVPRAQGEALAKIAGSGHLPPDWVSSDGLRIRVTSR